MLVGKRWTADREKVDCWQGKETGAVVWEKSERGCCLGKER